jgi:glycogen debranching enzyme
MVSGLHDHLGQAGIGSVSEIFDAEEPFTARGCIAQAWSVAELIRATAQVSSGRHLPSAPLNEGREHRAGV